MTSIQHQLSKNNRLASMIRQLKDTKEDAPSHIEYRKRLITSYSILKTIIKDMDRCIDNETKRLERHIEISKQHL
jgi:hypothetical protein